MAVGQPSFQQAYSGLVTFGKARPPPVSTTVDVGYEQRRSHLWANLPLRARVNAMAYLEQRDQ
eukprot:3392935-Lingulodinium_polyedra.AAC.1